MIDPNTDRVLITGAAGAIGTALRDGLRPHWRHLRLTDIRPLQNLTANEEAMVADIADRTAIEAMMPGVRAVVHLAGVAGNYDLEALFRVNARGLFDVFEAARLAGVQRIVFASSNHAFGCYPITERVSPALPARPDSLYGVFKVLGETMLRYYYDRHGIASVSLRIGTYRPQPIDQRSLATWLSPADIAQLVDLSLRHPDPGCMVINGYSNNTRLKTHDPGWATLGYRPCDNAEEYRAMLRAQGIDVDAPDRDEWEWREHGGSFARAPEHPARHGVTGGG
jgi:uronate dehydrogenase